MERLATARKRFMMPGPDRGGTLRRRLFDHVVHAHYEIMKVLDRVWVPLSDVAYAAYVKLCPERFLRDLDAGINRGITFFEAQDRFSLDALVTLTLMVNATFEPKLSTLHDQIRSYAKCFADPHLRLVDENYHPDRACAGARQVDLEELERVEKPVVNCLYADSVIPVKSSSGSSRRWTTSAAMVPPIC